MGPLISVAHQRKVLDYIESGKAEAKLLCGGAAYDDERASGNFVQPTVFTDAKPDARILREEIFGPVLVVQLFDTEEEALRLANDTEFGLAGAVFTSDGARAQRFIRKLRAGITWINTYHPTFNEAPSGGYKQERHRARTRDIRLRRLHRGEADQHQPLARPGRLVQGRERVGGGSLDSVLASSPGPIYAVGGARFPLISRGEEEHPLAP